MISDTVATGSVGLHYIETGSGSPVLVLHGFSGSAEAMRPLVVPLARSHRVVAVDIIGHGSSPTPPAADDCTMEAVVAQIDRVIAELGLAPAHLVGYSMGGRIALSYAVAHPDRVASVIAIGASPGIAEEAERAERVAADSALADHIVAGGVDWFVSHWESLPILQPGSAEGIARAAWVRELRLANDPAGLAAALRGLGTGSMPPLHDRLAGLDVPALLIVGEKDNKFRAIAADLVGSIPHSRLVVVDDAGHSVHLDNAQGLARVVEAFAASIDAGARQ